MNNIFPFRRIRITKDDRTYRPSECTHRHIKLDSRGGIVTCSDCGAALSPFRALTMLGDQYALALSSIDSLQVRLTQANERILQLAGQLDATRAQSEKLPQSVAIDDLTHSLPVIQSKDQHES
ncbi:hypothetical protein [Caballeronia sp. 15711]|uniref:hypothetical protein n=1 Tax=Caballeronia sp. 15711 TaxID=3391029 RepID=UPI0039E6671F